MSDFMSNIGQFFSGPSGGGLMKLLEAGMTGAGLFGNLATQRARSQELNYLKQSQAALADPTAIAKQVAATTAPLDRALLQQVNNAVSGTLAEQGLSQAPGIQAAATTQAVAPFAQQNQQRALEIVMQRLGLPIQYAQAYLSSLPGGVNLAPLMALLAGGLKGATGTPMTPAGTPFDYGNPSPIFPTSPGVTPGFPLPEPTAPDIGATPPFWSPPMPLPDTGAAT